jgi:hypothetical protein
VSTASATGALVAGLREERRGVGERLAGRRAPVLGVGGGVER